MVWTSASFTYDYDVIKPCPMIMWCNQLMPLDHVMQRTWALWPYKIILYVYIIYYMCAPLHKARQQVWLSRFLGDDYYIRMHASCCSWCTMQQFMLRYIKRPCLLPKLCIYYGKNTLSNALIYMYLGFIRHLNMEYFELAVPTNFASMRRLSFRVWKKIPNNQTNKPTSLPHDHVSWTAYEYMHGYFK